MVLRRKTALFGGLTALVIASLIIYYIDNAFWGASSGLAAYLPVFSLMVFAFASTFYFKKNVGASVGAALLFLIAVKFVFFLGPYIHIGIGVNTRDPMYTLAYLDQLIANGNTASVTTYVGNDPIPFILLSQLQQVTAIPSTLLIFSSPFFTSLLILFVYLITKRIIGDSFLAFFAAMLFAFTDAYDLVYVFQRLMIYYLLCGVFILMIFLAHDSRLSRKTGVVFAILIIPLLFSETLTGLPIALALGMYSLISFPSENRYLSRIYSKLDLKFSKFYGENLLLVIVLSFSVFSVAYYSSLQGLLIQVGFHASSALIVPGSTVIGTVFKVIAFVFATVAILLGRFKANRSMAVRTFLYGLGMMVLIPITILVNLPTERLVPFYFIFMLPLSIFGVYLVSSMVKRPTLLFSVISLTVLLVGILSINNLRLFSYQPIQTSSAFEINGEDVISMTFLGSAIHDLNVFFNPDWSGLIYLDKISWHPFMNDTGNYDLTDFKFVIWESALNRVPPYTYWATVTPRSVFNTWDIVFTNPDLKVYAT